MTLKTRIILCVCMCLGLVLTHTPYTYAQDTFEGLLQGIESPHPSDNIANRAADTMTGNAPALLTEPLTPNTPINDAINIEQLDENSTEKTENAPDENLSDKYKDIPDAYIEEAFAFQTECQKDRAYKNYYDCTCLAVSYLDMRIEGGTSISPLRIKNQLQEKNSCLDLTEAAGVAYKECLGFNKKITGYTIPIEQYCTCMANTYAKNFERTGTGPSSKKFIILRSNAMSQCRNPKFAAKFAEETKK